MSTLGGQVSGETVFSMRNETFLCVYIFSFISVWLGDNKEASSETLGNWIE